MAFEQTFSKTATKAIGFEDKENAKATIFKLLQKERFSQEMKSLTVEK